MSRSGPVDVGLFDEIEDIDTILLTERIIAERDHDVGHHMHTAHELLWGMEGSRTVQSGAFAWLLPPTVGMWIPAGTPHTGLITAGASYYCTLIHPDRCPITWTEMTPVAMTPPLREMLLHLHSAPLEDDERHRAELVVIDLIRSVKVTTVALPMPFDARARDVAVALLAQPADDRTIDEWGRHVGAAGRTLNRLFTRQTGMSFSQWRMHARVRSALPLLAAGAGLAEVGRRVGYQTPSGFVRVFRQVTGQTPGAFVAANPISTPARWSSEHAGFDEIKG